MAAPSSSPSSSTSPSASSPSGPSSPPPEAADPRTGLRLPRKLFWISVLYFAEGFPFGIAYDVWPVYFRVHGVSLADIGLMSLLFLPYTLKPAWAPLVDRFGSRQVWVVVVELALAGLTLVLLGLDPSQVTVLLWVVLLGFTLLSATQDIAIDAYAVDLSTARHSGAINGVRVSAYRAALLIAGGLVVLLADYVGWTTVWFGCAGIFVLAAVLTQASPRVPRGGDAASLTLALGNDDVSDRDAAETTDDRSTAPPPPPPAQGPSWAGAPPLDHLGAYRAGSLALTAVLLATTWLSGWETLWLVFTVIAGAVALGSFLEPTLLRWLLRWQMAPVVFFILTYKLADSTLGRMVKPFWVDRGLSLAEIGVVSSSLGVALTIAGALLGGWFTTRKGIFAGLLVFGILQALSNFGYVAVAAFDLGTLGSIDLFGWTLELETIYLASIIESFTQGLGTAAFLAYLTHLCDREHAATQFALLSSLFAVSRDLAGSVTGFAVEALGYTEYFLYTALLAIPALVVLPFLRSTMGDDEEGDEAGDEAPA